MVYVKTLDVSFLYQSRSKPVIHQSEFCLKYILDTLFFVCCLVSTPLYTMFTDLTFQVYCQIILTLFRFVQSVHFIYYLKTCHINFKSFWLVAFPFQGCFLLELYKYHQHKETSYWQHLGANHWNKSGPKTDSWGTWHNRLEGLE